MTRPYRALAAADLASWPTVAQFCRGYLHQDAGHEHSSMVEAFEAFWAEASAAERLRFVGEWDALMARIDGQSWVHVRRALEALGTSWISGGRSGVAALQRAIHERSQVT